MLQTQIEPSATHSTEPGSGARDSSEPPPKPSLPDPSFDRQYGFSAHNPRYLHVLDGEFLDGETLRRLRTVASQAAQAVRCKLNGKEASVVNLLKVKWSRDVFCKLADYFQLDNSGLESDLTFTVWASFLTVVLKGSFFNCASFSEIYSFKEDYGDTTNLLPESTFMEMKRGLSC